MTKLTAKKSTNTKNTGKEAALKALAQSDDYLDGPITNGRVDLDKRIHKSLKSLGAATETTDGRSVTMRMLVTEALLDLFEKYDKGEGKYTFAEEDDWSWNK